MKEENVKNKIGFDLDGVLIDHTKNRKKVSEKLGLGGKSKKVENIIYGKMSSTADIVRGAKKSVRDLAKSSELFVVSRRNSDSREVARKWLKKHFDFNPKNIFFVDKDEDKADMIKKLGIDVFIDDKMSALFHIKGKTKKFLFDEAGSYKKERYGGIKVVHSHDEFLREIKSFL